MVRAAVEAGIWVCAGDGLHGGRAKEQIDYVLVMGYTAVALKSRLIMDEGIVVSVAVVGPMAMALLASMGLVAAERSEGSLGTLLALPVESWKIFAVKMAMGAAVCTGPLLGSAVLSVVMAGGREISGSRVVSIYSAGFGFGLALFVWMVAFGISQPSEARAGLVGIAVVLVWMAFLTVCDFFLNEPLKTWSTMVVPFGFFRALGEEQTDIGPKTAFVQIVTGSCLLVWAAYRFGRSAKRVKE
ncbi:MAG: ABC transporter permease subunit [Planctomycetota bacterium]|jgi:ABC-type transport system involved in multi-copper enzyme maturation permease subunit